LWTSIICPKPETSLWHVRGCLLGECEICEIDTLKVCPKGVQFQNLVSWKSIGYEIVGHTKDGKKKKVSKLEYHETPLLDLI
jgi:hypothetical protein